jgi:hypothetical protein
LRWAPDIIGIESNAFQAALVQQAERLPSMPPIVPIFAKGKKYERIMAMSPLFKIGKIRIKKDHKDFIDEWINYDASISNPRDDCLDSVEIALRTAGALLAESFLISLLFMMVVCRIGFLMIVRVVVRKKIVTLTSLWGVCGE